MDAISVPQSTLEIVGRLLMATFFGAAIGINREWQRKPAGLRTHALVALGGSLFTVIGLLLHADDPSATGRFCKGLPRASASSAPESSCGVRTCTTCRV